MGTQIENIHYYLPEHVVTNSDLKRECPDWDVDLVASKTGVLRRHIAAPGETAFDLSCKAAEMLFQDKKNSQDSIDGILYCTQSPDYIMPSNAFLLHRHLGMDSHVWAFDFNLACSGFVYGLAIAKGMMKTVPGRSVLLITADTYSRFINPQDRSTRMLFGDGAAATLLTASSKDSVFDIELASSGNEYDTFYIPAGGCRIPKNQDTGITARDSSGNIRSRNDIHMNGFAVWKFISKTVPDQIQALLARNSLSIGDIDLFCFHQASKLTLDSLSKNLGINPAKVYMNLDRVGNTVSASIPIAMKDAMNEGKLKRGDLVLLSGFGVGLSWASAVMEF